MKIFALVTDAFGGHGGIAKFNRDLLTALCAAPGVEKVVALPRLIPAGTGTLPEKLEFTASGVGGKIRYALAVLRSSIHHPRSSIIICGHINLLPLAFLARCVMRLRRRFPLRLDRRESDATLAYRMGEGLGVRVLGEVSNSAQLPIVLVVHGIDAWQPTRSALVNRLVRKVNAVVAVSEFTRKKFWDWARPETARSFILPNCVDLAQFTPGPKSLALLDRYGLRKQTIMLTVARLSAAERYKGIDEVIEVLPALMKEIPNLCYLIVGDGDDRPRLMEKARSLGFRVGVASKATPSPPRSDPSPAGAGEGGRRPGERRGERTNSGSGQGEVSNPTSILDPPSSVSPLPFVIFAGHVPESEKMEHYRLADVFVMPGWGEGFGIVYLEAMACGVPVVASKLDASQEAVREGKIGVLVNPRVPEDIVSGTLTALRSPRGVPAGLEHFSQASFQSRTQAIIGELTAR